MQRGRGRGNKSDRGHERLTGESPETKDKRKCAPGARQREIVNDALWTTCDREDKRERLLLLLLLPLASSRPTVANDAANGHLCDMYDIYFYQWYWGISKLLVWFTQQGENNFQGSNLLWKLLIRHICVCCQIFGSNNLCLMPHARCHTILSLSSLLIFFSHISFLWQSTIFDRGDEGEAELMR